MPDTWVKDGNVQFQALGYWVGDESNDQQQQYVKNGFVYDLLGKTFFGKNLVEIYKFNGPNEESNNHEGSAGKEEYLKIHSNPGGLVLIIIPNGIIRVRFLLVLEDNCKDIQNNKLLEHYRKVNVFFEIVP